MAAVVAQLMRQRQRARERAFEIRKLQLSWLATQSFPVLLAMASSGAGQSEESGVSRTPPPGATVPTPRRFRRTKMAREVQRFAIVA